METSHYKAVLDDLRERRKRLDELIANLEAFAGGEAPPSPPEEERGSAPSRPLVGATQANIKADTFFGMNVPDAIKKYLEMKKRPEKAKDISRGLEEGGVMTQAKNFYANVSTALRRLEDAGEVVRINDSKKWGLAAWYPGRPKTKPKTGADAENDGAPEAGDDSETAGETEGQLKVV